VIAELGGWQGVGAAPQHQPDTAAHERLPVVAVVPLLGEAEDISEIACRSRQIAHGKDVGVGLQIGLAHVDAVPEGSMTVIPVTA